MRFKVGVLLSMVVLFWVVAGGASAANRFVSPAGTNAGACTSSAAPCKTLIYAVSQAVSGDTIKAAAGTYTENLILSKSLTLKGASMNGTVIDGNAAGRVLVVQPGITVNISEMTLRNGNISNAGGGGILNDGILVLDSVIVSGNKTSGGSASESGGGVLNTGNLTIQYSYVYNNSALNSGGGIYNAPGASLTITDSTIKENSAPNLGGGIYNNGATAVLKNSELLGNYCPDGGGLYNDNSANATLDHSNLVANSGSFGGGIYNNNSSSLTLNYVTFSGHHNAKLGGGLLNAASATLTYVVFADNTASAEGGGMKNAGPAVMTNVTFSHDAAGVGGGLFNAGPLTLVNGTFNDNSAANVGGGILNINVATITNATFAGNLAGSPGGAIYAAGTLHLKNTIVANSLSGGNCAPTALPISDGNNIDSENSCGFDPLLKDQVKVDPRLQRLTKHGKRDYTQTIALLPDSPAIDQGDNSACTAKDQRGAKRPFDGDNNGSDVCDIGAYELR